MKWLEDRPRVQEGLRRALESVSPRARRHSAYTLLVRTSLMTLEFSTLHANSASIGFTARAASAWLEEGIPLQVRIHPTSLLPLSLVSHRLIIIFFSNPSPEPHPRAYPSHLPSQIKSVFMKKEMARLKDSEPDLPHRDRYVHNHGGLMSSVYHIKENRSMDEQTTMNLPRALICHSLDLSSDSSTPLPAPWSS